MDFAMPADLQAYLDELDAFIEAEIKPLEDADDRILDTEHLIGIVADLDFHSVGSRHLAADIGGQGAVCHRRCRKQGEGYRCN